MKEVTISGRTIGLTHPTYFIAEVGSNHDGDLERAKALVHLAAESGAEAVKFQNFSASKIVSEVGFRDVTPAEHQAAWKKSIVDTYADAETPPDWTPVLKRECDAAGVHYLSSPYDLDAVDMLDPYVPAYKIGSGDIDWIEEITHAAVKGKPVILATGASAIADVQRAVQAALAVNPQLILLQCNTNYTACPENFHHLHLNVLKTYATMFPEVVLGLSDHMRGPVACLGAVALGARVIERHFTDDDTREGMDHRFATPPGEFRDLVDRTRELEQALGSHRKFVAENETDSALVQRRSLYAARDIRRGEMLTRDAVSVLRPALPGSILPPELGRVLQSKALDDIAQGAPLRWQNVG